MGFWASGDVTRLSACFPLVMSSVSSSGPWYHGSSGSCSWVVSTASFCIWLFVSCQDSALPAGTALAHSPARTPLLSPGGNRSRSLPLLHMALRLLMASRMSPLLLSLLLRASIPLQGRILIWTLRRVRLRGLVLLRIILLPGLLLALPAGTALDHSPARHPPRSPGGNRSRSSRSSFPRSSRLAW